MKNLLRTLGGEVIDPPPIWLMRQAGRHLEEYKKLRKKADSFLSFCYSPDLALEATLQPVQRYHMDGAIVFSDILVIPDSLGQRVSFVESKGPTLVPIKTVKDIERLSTTHLYSRLKPVYETITQLTKKVPPETALIGFSGAPWTLAAYMIEGGSSRDFQRTRLWAYKEPEEFQLLIDCLIEVTSAHLIYQLDAGAEVVQIFDTWAGVLSAKQFQKWVINPVSRMVEIIKERHPLAPIIGFPRGAGLNYECFAVETGVDAVSVDSTIPLKWVSEKIQPHCVVQGNLDNLVLLEGGVQLEKDVFDILNYLGNGPFIFNLGHGVLPETPVPHVEKLIKLVRKG